MVNSTQTIGIIAAAGAAIGIGYYLTTQNKQHPPSQMPAKLTLSAASTSIIAGQSDTFSAVLLDQNGSPIPNYKVTFSEQGIGNVISANTDSSGTAKANIAFDAQGTYTIMAIA